MDGRYKLRVHIRVIHSAKEPEAFKTLILDYSGEKNGDEDTDKNTQIIWTGHVFDAQASILEVYSRVADDLKTKTVQNAFYSAVILYGPFKRSPMTLVLDNIEPDDLCMTFWNPEEKKMGFSSYVPHRKDAIVFENETGRRLDSFESIYSLAAAPQISTYVGTPSVDLFYYADPIDFVHEPIFGDGSSFFGDDGIYHVSIAIKDIAIAVAADVSSPRAAMIERVFFRPHRKVPKRVPRYYPDDLEVNDLVTSLIKPSYFSIVALGPRINLRSMFRSLKLRSHADDIIAAVSFAKVYGSFNGVPRVNEESEELRVSKAVISRITDISTSKIGDMFSISKSKNTLETITGYMSRKAAVNPSDSFTKDPINEIVKITVFSKLLLDQQLFDKSGVIFIYIYDNGFVQAEYADDREDHFHVDFKKLFNNLALAAETYVLDPACTYLDSIYEFEEPEYGSLKFEIARVTLQVIRFTYSADSIMKHGPFKQSGNDMYVYTRSSDHGNALAKRIADQKASIIISRYGPEASADSFPLRSLMTKEEMAEIQEVTMSKAEIFYRQKLSSSRNTSLNISWTPVVRIHGKRHHHTHYRMFIDDIFSSTMLNNIQVDLLKATSMMLLKLFKNREERLLAIQKLYIEHRGYAVMSIDPKTFAYTNNIFGTSTRYAMVCPKNITVVPLVPGVSDDESRHIISRILKKSDVDAAAINIMEFEGFKYTCIDPTGKFVYPKKRIAFTDVTGKDHVIICCSISPENENTGIHPDDVVELPTDTITRIKTSVGSTMLPDASNAILNAYGSNLKVRDFAFIRYGPRKRTSAVRPRITEHSSDPSEFTINNDYVSEQVLSSLIEAFEFDESGVETIRDRLAEFADNDFQRDMFINDARIVIDEALSVASKRGTFVRGGCNIVVLSEAKTENTKVCTRFFSPRNIFDPELDTFLFSEEFREDFDTVLKRIPGQVSRLLVFNPIYVIKRKETGKFNFLTPFSKYLVPSMLFKKYTMTKIDDWDFGIFFLLSKIAASDQKDMRISGYTVSPDRDIVVCSGDMETDLYVIIAAIDDRDTVGHGIAIIPIDKESFSRAGTRRVKRLSLLEAKFPTLESMVYNISKMNLAVSSIVVDPFDMLVHGLILNTGIYVPVDYEQVHMEAIENMMLGESIVYEADHLRVERTGNPREDNIVDYVSIGLVELFKDVLKMLLYVSASKTARNMALDLKTSDAIRTFATTFVAARTKIVASFNASTHAQLKSLGSARTAVRRLSDILGLSASISENDKVPIPDSAFRDDAVSFIVSRASGIDTPEMFSKGLIKAYVSDRYSSTSKGEVVSERMFEDCINITQKNFEEAISVVFSGTRKMSVIEGSAY